MLGPGNEEAATRSVAEWRGGLQVGGGVRGDNAAKWIERGAGKVCFFLFALGDAGSMGSFRGNGGLTGVGDSDIVPLPLGRLLAGAPRRGACCAGWG